MIQGIRAVSFGSSPAREIKTEIKKAQITKDELIDGTIGAGGAAVVANGNKAMKAIAGVSQKSANTVANVSKNTQKFQQYFLGVFKTIEGVKGLSWLAKAAKSPVTKGVGKVFGGFAAVGLCATDFANIVNVGSRMYDGERFPTLSSFGK